MQLSYKALAVVAVLTLSLFMPRTPVAVETG